MRLGNCGWAAGRRRWVGFLMVASGVGRLLGWHGGCRLRDPPAVIASTLEKNWLVASLWLRPFLDCVSAVVWRH